MTDFTAAVTALARDLVALDSRSFVSNLPVIARTVIPARVVLRASTAAPGSPRDQLR